MELKQSINKAQIVGTLKEINLELSTKETTLRGANGVEKKVTCNVLTKKEFKNPTFLIEAKGCDIGVNFFPTYEKKLNENNEVVDNPNYKALLSAFENYVPKSVDSDNATRVIVNGNLMPNEYVDRNGEFKSFPQINAFSISSSDVPKEDTTDSEISGVIHTIIDETRGEENESTGRLVVELYTFDRNSALLPLKFVVESDIASDFSELYEAGQSVCLSYEILTRQVGGTKKSVGTGFGRRESHMVSGFSITEYSVFRGDDPFDEENEYYVDIETVKKALAEREAMIETKITEAKNKATTSSASPKGASAKATSAGASNPFGGGSTPKTNPFA